MAKSADEPKKHYRTVKVLEDIVLKANIITEVNGGTAADYLSDLIEEQTTIEKDYADALKKLNARKKS
jgi:hypothetical protein